MQVKSAFYLRSLFLNAGIFTVGILGAVVFVLISAQLPTEGPQEAVSIGFADGTLTTDITREVAAVPGFIVMPSDAEGSCSSYSHMLSPPEDVFGLGLRPIEAVYGCEALAVAVNNPTEANTYSEYFRYWHGASAVSKVALTFVSVRTWHALLTLTLLVLVFAMAWTMRRFSATLALGTIIILIVVTDIPWQGIAPLHGVSTAIALASALLTLLAFERKWAVRWAIAALGGGLYAISAHTLIPTAFAMFTAICAMIPLLKQATVRRDLSWGRGLLVGVMWMFGYVLGTGSRAVWVTAFGPGQGRGLNEWGGTSTGYVTRSLIDPLYQTFGTLMKTWFSVGTMQVGLVLFALVLGWSLAKCSGNPFSDRRTWLTLSPSLIGIGWLLVWAWHTPHLYVHAVPSIILLNILFAVEAARSFRNSPAPGGSPSRSSALGAL